MTMFEVQNYIAFLLDSAPEKEKEVEDSTPTPALAPAATPIQSQATPIQPQATPTISTAHSSSGGGASSDGATNNVHDIVIKRGRGAAKTLNLEKLQMPLNQG